MHVWIEKMDFANVRLKKSLVWNLKMKLSEAYCIFRISSDKSLFS